MSGYDYAAFLKAVRLQRRTAPTGCFYCDVVLETTCGPAETRRLQRVCEERSSYVVDAHHAGVPKQLLKREFPHGVYVSSTMMEPLLSPPLPNEDGRFRSLDDLLMDPRNGVLLRRHHHDLVEVRGIPKVLLPAETLAFAGELGLGWYLDKMDERRG